MRLGLHRLLYLLCTTLLLSACVTMPPSNVLTVRSVSELKQFVVSGKLAVITPNKKQSARLFWQQLDATSYKVSASTVLGISVFSAQRHQNLFSVVVEGQTYQSDEPTQLLFDLTGWWLPVDDFGAWLRADVNASEGQIEYHADSTQLKTFTPICTAQCSSPLTIAYSDYRPYGQLMLPHSIRIDGSGERSQTLKLRINEWR